MRIACRVPEPGPQAADVDIDHPLVAVEVVPPHPLQQLRPGEHPPRGSGKCGEQVELQAGQHHRRAVRFDLAADRVDHQTVEPQRRVPLGANTTVPAQHRLDPGRHFPRTERLGHVVVRTDAQPDELVNLLRPCSDQDDVGIAEGAQLPEHLQPVNSRQHDIQQHQIGPPVAERGQRALAVSRLRHVKPVRLQVATQDGADMRLVIDDQHPSHRSLLRIGPGGRASARPNRGHQTSAARHLPGR
jgi:hypothetical protein